MTAGDREASQAGKGRKTAKKVAALRHETIRDRRRRPSATVARTPESGEPKAPERRDVNAAIGRAIAELRELKDMTASELAKRAGVSPAMVSRIEKGQVSPSLTMLAQLSSAMGVPMSAFFREAGSAVTDITHVKRGAGLKAVRQLGDHAHEYVVLGFHRRPDLQFESHLITVKRNRRAAPPTYAGQGCVAIYVLEGKAIYRYGDRLIRIGPGDSLSLDAEQRYGVQEVLTPRLRFLSVQAERRR